VRAPRNYPEQPPVIPHAIEGYEISLRANKCLSCHGRTRVQESQAPMISITHFFDRDGQTLASLAAPVFLHAVPRSPARRARPGRERFFRYRYVAHARGARGPAVTTTEASPPSFASRALAFARDIWDALRRPSTVFSLGLLVLAGFAAGIIFWAPLTPYWRQ